MRPRRCNRLYLPAHILGLACVGYDLEVADAPPNRCVLVRVDDAAKRITAGMSSRCLGQQVRILGEEHSIELGGAVHERRISSFAGSIFKRCEHGDTSQAQADDRPRRVQVHTQGKRHERRQVGEGPRHLEQAVVGACVEVGLLQGRLELPPRALVRRAILAHSTRPLVHVTLYSEKNLLFMQTICFLSKQ